jgi:hypothetical protein
MVPLKSIRRLRLTMEKTAQTTYEVFVTGNLLQARAECSGAYTLRSTQGAPGRWLTSDPERNRLKKMLSVVVLLI